MGPVSEESQLTSKGTEENLGNQEKKDTLFFSFRPPPPINYYTLLTVPCSIQWAKIGVRSRQGEDMRHQDLRDEEPSLPLIFHLSVLFAPVSHRTLQMVKG